VEKTACPQYTGGHTVQNKWKDTWQCYLKKTIQNKNINQICFIWALHFFYQNIKTNSENNL